MIIGDTLGAGRRRVAVGRPTLIELRRSAMLARKRRRLFHQFWVPAPRVVRSRRDHRSEKTKGGTLMRSFATLVLTAAALAGCSPAEPEKNKLWVVTGLSNPESAVPDTKAGVIYVSNVAGEPSTKDGNGFIAKIGLDGKVIALKWATGLDAPKGLALAGGHLFAADIDRLVEIDTADGKIVARHEAKDAQFLNDVAADPQGRIYVSDMNTNTIWRLDGGHFEPWLVSQALKNPNGLLVHGDKLIVAAWGAEDGKGPLGNLVEVSLADKSVRDLGDGKPIGNLDGIEPFDANSFLVTDWIAGKLYRIEPSGKADVLMTLSPGSADIGYIPSTRTVLIPMMKTSKLLAYKLD
jgi:sugar lactone lactonase YvrE